MKTKKAKIIVVTILLVVTLLGATFTALSFNKVSYAPSFNKPDRIIVYNQSSSSNIVFEPADKNYNTIYSLMLSGCKKPILPAILAGDLSKNVKVHHVENSKINFKDIVINFVYDTPQIVRLKNKTYNNNGKNYWYQNLIFELFDENKFEYNNIAIISPESSIDYISPYTYSSYYQVYSNFNDCYEFSKKLFS